MIASLESSQIKELVLFHLFNFGRGSRPSFGHLSLFVFDRSRSSALLYPFGTGFVELEDVDIFLIEFLLQAFLDLFKLVQSPPHSCLLFFGLGFG